MVTLAILSILGMGSILGLADMAIAQEQALNQDNFEVEVGNKTYQFYYQMNNTGSIDSISIDTPLSLLMRITSPSNGTLELTFPRELYDALSFTEHDEPLLYVGGKFSDELPVISKSCEQISITIPVQAGIRDVELLYADILMNHSHSYPEDIVLVKEIERDNQTHTVVLFTDAKKCDVTFSEVEELIIQIDIKGRDEVTTIDQGYFAITIPHALLGGSYTVLVDGEQASSVQEPYGNAAFYNGDSPVSQLIFNYTKNASTIKIMGTTVAFDYLSYPSLSNMAGDIIYDTEVGQQSIISLSVQNNNPTEELYVILVEIRDANDVTRDLFWQTGMIEANGNYTMGTSWSPSEEGNNYQIRSFIIHDINSTIPSSGVFSLGGITVVEPPLYQFCCTKLADNTQIGIIMNTSYSFEYTLDAGHVTNIQANFDTLSMLLTFEGVSRDSYLTLKLPAPLMQMFFPDE